MLKSLTAIIVFIVSCIVCGLCCAEVSIAKTTSSKPVMQVRFHKIPAMSEAYTYRYELIHEILEVSRPEFGDYEERVYEAETTAKRQAQLLADGTLNLNWASPGTDIAKANSIPIPIDFLNGLISYRVCLINKAAPLQLDTVNTVETLRHVKIGQGPWADVEFYRFNQIEPVIAPTFEGLFKMLSLKRFDCLALGINEVSPVFEEKKAEFPFLDIDKQLLIHYYFPMYFYVSNKNPELAQRMEFGLKKLIKNGTFNRIFMKYHGKTLQQLHLYDRKIICLKSPYVEQNQSCTLPDDLL